VDVAVFVLFAGHLPQERPEPRASLLGRLFQVALQGIDATADHLAVACPLLCGEVTWPVSLLLDLLPNLPGQMGHEAVGDAVVLAQGLEDGQPGDGDGPAALPHFFGQ
jgi:hypothetical protein